MTAKPHNERPHPFGEALTRLIEQKGLRKYRIAKRLNKQSGEITRMETQKGAPKWDTIFDVAKAMEIDPREIFSLICDIWEERYPDDKSEK